LTQYSGAHKQERIKRKAKIETATVSFHSLAHAQSDLAGVAAHKTLLVSGIPAGEVKFGVRG
jgi:hypothetical protein